MIVDRLQNWKYYPLGEVWKQAMEFLMTLEPDAEEKEYPLDGDRVFARIMSYETIPAESARFEAHRTYADIQTVLSGEEILEWSPTSGLEVTSPYDSSKDVEFYSRLQPGRTQVRLSPGFFALLLPQDAHAPQLQCGKAVKVKKVVIKIDIDLLRI